MTLIAFNTASHIASVCSICKREWKGLAPMDKLSIKFFMGIVQMCVRCDPLPHPRKGTHITPPRAKRAIALCSFRPFRLEIGS
jgi:hypothetical protein